MLTDSQKEMLKAKTDAARTLMDGVKADFKAKKLYENPNYTLDQVINCNPNLKKDCEAIFSLPPPKVEDKPEDVKMDDKAAKSGEKKKEGDADMKDEEKKPEGSAENGAK